MCGRYSLILDVISEKMQQMVDICNEEAEEDMQIILDETGEVQPGGTAPVLYYSSNGVRAASMKWGMEKFGKLIINARVEDLCNRAMFRPLLQGNRCALPACSYFEWRDSDHQKHQIASANSETFYLVGLHRMCDDGKRHFVVITREAVGGHAKIHKRMPVVLMSRSEARDWVSGRITPEELTGIAVPELSIEAVGSEQLTMDFFTQFELD